MLHYEIDAEADILTLTPEGELTAQDFKRITDVVDQHNASGMPVRFLMIVTEHFPGWENFAALFQHLKFIRHERHLVKKVAAVTDSGFLAIMPEFIDHFVQADVRHFDFDQREEALSWLRE